MKSVLKIIILLVTSSVHAEVIKPPNTITTVYGTSLIENISFGYSIDDRGWTTSGHAENGNWNMEGHKTFLMIFESHNHKINFSKSIKSSITKEATEKCKELGALEYPGQIKGLPREAKTSLKTEIINGNADTVSDTQAWGTFVCLVQVKAESK